MAKETKPTARAENPTRVLLERALGVIKAKRGAVPVGGASVTIPGRVRRILIRCTHATKSFGMNFNSDTYTDYWEVKPGDKDLELWINDTTVINVKGIGGNSSYEAIFMG